ncbi:MAG TPA: acyl-CoA dehydrogenase family protein [Microthrixaceae bacterium]|nr:acyl-CoA dehydrogenase family protein [Microthrixaceae bacterium]
MDFRISEVAEELRSEVQAFLEEQITEELEERVYRTGVSHDEGFSHALSEQGWMAPGWPVELGGQGRGPLETLALHEELRFVDAPTYAIGTSMMVATVVREAGTEEQQRELIPKVLAGDIVIVLGFTEPEVGSDLAAASCKAVRDGDQWVINGQKMFTTNAHVADYVFLVTRTNTEVPKHKGITMFVVPMDQAGVEVQAVYTLSGERTNIVFFNDVHVDDAWRIGDVDRGWETLTVALAAEHGAAFSPAIRRLLASIETWATETRTRGGTPLDDPDVRELVGRTATSFEVSQLLQRRVAWMGAEDIPVERAESSMAKLFSSEALEARAQEACETVGPDALRSYFDPTAPVNGMIEHLRRFSLGTTIYAGTSEVHRNMIAQRGLGLPRSK